MEDAVDFTTSWEFIVENDTVACDSSAALFQQKVLHFMGLWVNALQQHPDTQRANEWASSANSWNKTSNQV